jgi:hypothetical protein
MSDERIRLLNLVLGTAGDVSFPMPVKDRLSVDPNAASKAMNSKNSRGNALWEAVYKLACRVETVQGCFEKGVQILHSTDLRTAQHLAHHLHGLVTPHLIVRCGY